MGSRPAVFAARFDATNNSVNAARKPVPPKITTKQRLRQRGQMPPSGPREA